MNEGYRTPPGESELVAHPEDELVSGEGLRTGLDSAIHVQFSDGSELRVEADSEILLSDYVFEPVNGAEGTIMLGEGLFHFDSNGAPDGGVELHTPVATIGIRGTEFLVTVSNGATVVDILDGAVEIKPVGGGKAITCVGGQSGLAVSADEDALCGDIGSFSTAAGVPAESTSLAQGKIGDNGASPDRPDKPSGNKPGGPTGGGPSGGGSSGGGGNPGGGAGGNPGGDPGGNPGGNPGGGSGGNPGGNPGKTNHSGLGDGTNPGKGHGNGNGNGSDNGNGNKNGHGGGNGGANNPGGGRK